MKIFLSITGLQFDSKTTGRLGGRLGAVGAPVGFCSSVFYTNLVLKCLDKNAVRKLSSSDLLLYKRYMDDCFLILRKSILEETLERFKNFDRDLQFTFEIESDNSLCFLDLKLIRVDGKILTDWYQKPTAS